MPRRDRDELPAIDIVGVGPESSSVQRVSRGPGGPRRRHLRGLVITAAVGGLLVAGLALGGDDSGGAPEGEDPQEAITTTTRQRSTTTRPDPPTTTSTTTAVGPLFAGQELHGWLLSGNPGGWTLVDLESGAVLRSTIPFEDPYSTRVVKGGVTTMRAGQVEYHDLRAPEDVREPVVLGPAELVVRAVEPDRVWLIQDVYAGAPTDGHPTDGHARLVDLAGRELRSFSVPTADYRAATTDGLLFERGGRVYLVDDLGVHPVAVGQLIGAVGSSVLVYSCDDDASCGIELRRSSGERVRRLALDAGAAEGGSEVWSDARGRFALVMYGETGSAVALFRPDGSLDATLDMPFGGVSGPLNWLPGDAGLVGTRNGRIAWIHSSSDGLVVEDVPALESIQSDGVLVISAS